MPIELRPLTRRGFLAAGAAAWTVGRAASVDDAPPTFAFLADTHIAADPRAMRGDTNMADNLKTVVADVLARPQRPRATFVHGDCAFLDGQIGDYTTLGELVEPLLKADIPIHSMIGNHDHRENFLAGVKSGLPKARPVASKHVSVVETPLVDFVTLDTLELVNKTPGLLGAEQLAWLAKTLDARPSKPVVVNLHHNPVFTAVLEKSGLKDTVDLWKVLAPRKQVKAVFFGHTHQWSKIEKDGIHVINLPPVAYVFTTGSPNGWVEYTAKPHGAALELRALDRKHKAHGEKLELAWRS